MDRFRLTFHLSKLQKDATFIKLLRATENMLGGSTNRSIWIHGAYGTGKSQCAFALKRILEVPEDELKTYWNSYDVLKKERDLLTKLLGHRDRGIVTVYRYATGGINTPQKFFADIQESVRKALENNNRVTYMGENTLKENVISWIEDPAHKRFFNDLLQKPEWTAKFSQSDADEVLNMLKKSGDIKDLLSNIFELADKEGITAMNLDADRLKAWLKDVIDQNHIKIVFFWDEFSKFFENNKYSLDEFQKVVALCQESPFYFVIVTHQAGSIIDDQDESWKVVQQRFDKGEFNSVAQVNGGLENMINWEGKDKDLLALIKYTVEEDKLAKVLENPQVLKTPVVRNGKQSTLGYQPDIWKSWN